MSGLQGWCYTVFAGVLFSGIILLLTPGQRFRPLMQLLLGAFLLICFFSWSHGAHIEFDIDTDEAEQNRQQVAERTQNYFMDRVKELSQQERETAAEEYLDEYGIKPGEFQIYMETEENPDGTKEAYLLLRLPERAAEYTLVISRALGYQLGIDVRIETYGTDAR